MPRRTELETPVPPTETLLQRIARMQAVLDNPLPYTERVARYRDETAEASSPSSTPCRPIWRAP